jgi:threonine dehydrogenase-like Zn-dependent dehydrogenase
MKALTVVPLKAGSAELSEVDEPPESDGPILVETLAVGICGTDIEILSGAYGWAPPGRERLVLGHRNGQYTERGIKEHDGYLSERYRITPDFVVKVDPTLGILGVLLEPTSVVAKAWEEVDRVGGRAHWDPKSVLITGAGPIGLLAALLGVQRGLDVHVIDQMTGGVKPDLVHDLGATYHHGAVADAVPDPDVIIECTGVASLVFDAMSHVGTGGVVCLTGVSSGGHTIEVDEGALNRSMVLENVAVVGSVNANRRHYEAAAAALAQADHAWLIRLVSRRVPLAQWQEALTRQPDDVKVVVAVAPE